MTNRSRYDAFSDPYLDPKFEILKNKFQAENQNQLDFLEDCIVTLRTAELLVHESLPQIFDLPYLREIHEFLFQDIYDWAGEFRNCGTSKGETLFCPPERIQIEGEKLFGKLLSEDFNQISLERFAERMGYYLGEINILHPFREGNGRTARVFLEMFARSLNFDIDWWKITQQEMVMGCVMAWETDHLYLASLLEKALFKPEF